VGLDRQRHQPIVLPLGKESRTQFTGGCVGFRVPLDGWGKLDSHRVLIARPSNTDTLLFAL